MNLKIPSLIIGICIIIAVFINNYYSNDRYSLRHVGTEEYSNVFVSYLTDRMTGKVKRITYTAFKNTKKPSELDSAQVKITDMTTGYYDAHNVVHVDNPFNKFENPVKEPREIDFSAFDNPVDEPRDLDLSFLDNPVDEPRK